MGLTPFQHLNTYLWVGILCCWEALMMMQQILFHFIVVSTQGSLNKSCNFLRKKKWKKCKCYGSVFPCKVGWKSSFKRFHKLSLEKQKSLLYGRYFYFISWDVMEVLYCRVNFQIDKLVPVKGYYYGVMDKTWPLKNTF